MDAPEKPEWRGTPRERQRPKVDKRSPFFGSLLKIVESNKGKNEKPPLEVYQESLLKEDIGVSCEHEIKLPLDRKDEEKINTDSKFKSTNIDLKDNVRHPMKESYEEVKTEFYAKSKHIHSDFQSSRCHQSKNKYKGERTEFIPKIQYEILDSQDVIRHQTKPRYETKVRTELSSKIHHYSTNFQDHRMKQTEIKHENRFKSECSSRFNQNSSVCVERRPEMERKYRNEFTGKSDFSNLHNDMRKKQTFIKHENSVRSDCNSKYNKNNSNSLGMRNQMERKHGKKLTRGSDSSDPLDDTRYSISRDHRKDWNFDRGDDQTFLAGRKYEASVVNQTSSKSHHTGESHGRHSYSSKLPYYEVPNYDVWDDKEIEPTSMHKSSAVVNLQDQELIKEEAMEFEDIKNVREILVNPDKEHSYSSKLPYYEVPNYDVWDDKEIEPISMHKSSAVVNLEDQELIKEEPVEFEDIKNVREILVNPDDENVQVTIKINDVRSPHLSNSSYETTSSNNVSDSQALKNDNTGTFLFSTSVDATSSVAVSDSQISYSDEAIPVCLSSSLPEITSSDDVFDPLINPDSPSLTYVPSEESYIPPPVQCKATREDSGFHEDSSNMAAGRNDELMPLNGNSEALPEFSYLEEDESYYSLPDTKQIEAISNFISSKVKEKSVNSSEADKVVRDLNSVFKDLFDGHTAYLYGSYSSDLAISTSDINLVMVSDCPRSIKKSFMYEIYKVILEKFENFHVYPYEEGSTIYETKINFSHPETGVKCQLAYLGKYRENMSKMGLFLRKISSSDERVKTLILAVKIWSESLCINDVEDGRLHTIGYALMVVYFLQRCENPILPDFPCELGEKEMLNSKSPNSLSIGELWLSFLNYYACTFDWKQNIISVTSNCDVSKQSKGWESYWLAIEDPFTEKNIAKSVVNSDIADFIKACFKTTYDYFCNPPECAIIDSSNEDDESSGSTSDTKWEFSFDQCNAEQDDLFCEECDELMDTCDNCLKKMYVEPVFTAPKMTDGFLEIVKDALTTVYKKYMLTDQEVDERKEFVKKLETRMCRYYSDFSDAEFSLFGSSANGFGFKNSDIDICITFKSNKVVNSFSVLKDVRFLLRKDKNFDQVIAIFNAQIPIVKFIYKPKGWRGDISLHNSLAIHNSSLLHTYSLLDERCKILGCALKLLAKKALISEVTDKALSSYSYLNMVIYFLQQTDPPVLPVLQDSKFRNNNYDINCIVENCNVWFCKDMDYINTEFQTENKIPVEQLWLDLLDYYCAFDSDKFVSIRQKEPVSSDGKKRMARLFNIQDPFIETKNLGCVVSAKKAQETINVLRRARKMFRTPIKELPTCVKDNEDFFFSTQSLTGRIHKEAHCELCGKYGHEKKECTHSSFPFPRFRFRRYTNNQFPNQRRNPNHNPCKNFASNQKTFRSKPVYQRA